MALTVGVGFTATVAVIAAAPGHAPILGVMVNVTVTKALVVFVRTPAISPLPLAAIPVTVPVLFLVQLNVAEGVVLVSAIVVMAVPEHTV